MKVYNKAILPSGFKAAGLSCGLKKSGKPDLALFYSAVPAKGACMFTANTLAAAPVELCRQHLRKGSAFQAVIANSGNANCFTGARGLKDARAMAKATAGKLKIRPEMVLVASTGIIAKPLDLGKIKSAIPHLAGKLSAGGIEQAKRAILTTDLFTKEVTVEFALGSKTVSICGVAKGAGMIAPDMATMLTFIFTDARISQASLKKALESCVDKSFNCITVDGCMSTNDSVILLANSCAGNRLISSGRDLELFTGALEAVCLKLSELIVRDGEGASKFIRIRVKDAKDYAEARKVALDIANSNLFKTAMYGENPNFGRIVAAVGASGLRVKEKDLKIKLSPLSRREIDVEVALGRGSCAALIFTSDLTPEYIKINAAYN